MSVEQKDRADGSCPGEQKDRADGPCPGEPKDRPDVPHPGELKNRAGGFHSLAPVLAAFGMFSRIPVPGVAWTPSAMRTMLAALPLVGVAQGLIAWTAGALLCRLGLPMPLLAAALTLIPIAVNGGIHLDGLSDTSDALASHAPREKLLQILSDPHIGAFGVLAIACHLLLAYALWSSLDTPSNILALLPALPATYAFSRALSGYAVACWPSAKQTGLASGFSRAAAPRLVPVLLAVEAVCAAIALGVAGRMGGVLAVAGALAMLARYRRVALSRFGGVTGDLAGWFLQYAELIMLGCLVVGRILWS